MQIEYDKVADISFFRCHCGIKSPIHGTHEYGFWVRCNGCGAFHSLQELNKIMKNLSE